MIASMTIPLRGAFRTFFDEFSTVHGDFCSKFFLPAFADIASCLDSAFYQEPLPFVDVIANGVGSLAECYAVDEIRFRILTFLLSLLTAKVKRAIVIPLCDTLMAGSLVSRPKIIATFMLSLHLP